MHHESHTWLAALPLFATSARLHRPRRGRGAHSHDSSQIARGDLSRASRGTRGRSCRRDRGARPAQLASGSHVCATPSSVLGAGPRRPSPPGARRRAPDREGGGIEACFAPRARLHRLHRAAVAPARAVRARAEVRRWGRAGARAVGIKESPAGRARLAFRRWRSRRGRACPQLVAAARANLRLRRVRRVDSRNWHSVVADARVGAVM